MILTHYIRGVGSFVKQVDRLKQEISALIPEIILSLKGYDNEACAGGFILTRFVPSKFFHCVYV